MVGVKNVAGLLLLLLATSVGEAQEKANAHAEQEQAAKTARGKPEAHDKTPEKASITEHSITLNGRVLQYTATAERMPLKNEQNQVEAQMFYVAYTLKNAPKPRPLTFAFNGGPGSASVWLHMGCFGPKRVKLLPNGFMPAPPFRWEDNPNTILDKTDLVFVDAIGTGYSRAESAELGKKFWSLNGDIAAFGEFIRLYLDKNARWSSPLYLAGESYGTTRAAGLSGYLMDHGIALNGITLISTILQFETVSFVQGNDLPYVLYLPTYALTAAYHHKLAAELEKDPVALRSEVERWAGTEYASALQVGDALDARQRETTVDHLARYTGLSKPYIERSNLRVDLAHFEAELLRDEGKTVGRLDTRFTGIDASGNEQSPDYDASESAVRPPYTAAFGAYVEQELNYHSDLTYFVLGGGIGHWDYGPTGGWSGFANTSEALRRALTKNPYLHVFIAEGLYDAATPYFAVDYTFNHMGLSKEAHQNVTRDQFEAGHMVYIDERSAKKLKTDVDALYDKAAQ